MKKKPVKAKVKVKGNHTIPGPVAAKVLRQYASNDQSSLEAEEIKDYVSSQYPKAKVTHLEKILTERIVGNDHGVWDVHTSKERFWVITGMTNLYDQELFPSADYTLTFHVGLVARMLSQSKPRVGAEQTALLMDSWRRWSQAMQALDQSHEAEEFQAVGMHCRETLLALVRALAPIVTIGERDERPKTSDFVGWSALIANALASGESRKDARHHLKATSKSTWDLANWLTHARSVTRYDGELVADATQAVLVAFSALLLRQQRGIPDSCPQCASVKVSTRYVKVKRQYRDVLECDSCGWKKIIE